MKPITFTFQRKKWTAKEKEELRDDSGERCDGLTDYDKHTIFLEKSLTKAAKETTLLHELLHVAFPYLSEEAVLSGEQVINLVQRRFEGAKP